MIELTRYYENAFFPIETSEGNFVEGTDRHIALFETNNPGGIYTRQNAPGQTKTVRSQGWSPSKALSGTNTGTTDFYIGFANAEGVPITSGELVAASQTREFTAVGLGYATGMSYLNVTGADGTGAKWRVELQ